MKPGRYQVGARWSPGSNRAGNTPYTVYQNGVGKTETTVRVDQTDPSTADRWNILGTFELAPDDSVVVTDDATGNETPSFVAADAIRLTEVTATGIADPVDLPGAVSLSQNYPNPFNPAGVGTQIEFELANVSFTRLVVYDLLGRTIATLVSERLSAGPALDQLESGGTWQRCLLPFAGSRGLCADAEDVAGEIVPCTRYNDLNTGPWVAFLRPYCAISQLNRRYQSDIARPIAYGFHTRR